MLYLAWSSWTVFHSTAVTFFRSWNLKRALPWRHFWLLLSVVLLARDSCESFEEFCTGFIGASTWETATRGEKIQKFTTSPWRQYFFTQVPSVLDEATFAFFPSLGCQKQNPFLYKQAIESNNEEETQWFSWQGQGPGLQEKEGGRNRSAHSLGHVEQVVVDVDTIKQEVALGPQTRHSLFRQQTNLPHSIWVSPHSIWVSWSTPQQLLPQSCRWQSEWREQQSHVQQHVVISKPDVVKKWRSNWWSCSWGEWFVKTCGERNCRRQQNGWQ